MSMDLITVFGSELGRLGLVIYLFHFSLKPIKGDLKNIFTRLSALEINANKISTLDDNLKELKKDIEKTSDKNSDTFEKLKERLYKLEIKAASDINHK